MEEPSLLLRVNITKNSWNDFLESPVKNFHDFSDWRLWLKEEKKMYGDPDDFVDNWTLYLNGRVRDNLDWMHYEYDEENEILVLSNLFFYGNFDPMLRVVSILRGISDFIKTDTVNNFLVIYPYWWGDRAKIGEWANVYIEFDQGKNLLTNILDKRNIDIATKYFDSKDEDWAKKCYEKIYG